ncbi:hypothetical protein AB0L57_18520 [Nocardia sp. NPDC052254]|uniref:terpene synthase family protein n=1 Tax=Nocardia sp. NPDC052254 TaxID=3155681 RepID=UPI003417D02F
MPQGIASHIPFPQRISVDVGRARAKHLDWPTSFGLLPDQRARERHLQGAYAELAGRFHPAVTGADLDLGVDQMSWFFLFDDLFDGTPGRSVEHARALTTATIAVLDRPIGAVDATDPPVVAAFADLWDRSRAGMSPAWCRRAATNWRNYIAGHVDEAANRAPGTWPTFADQLTLRQETSGTYPIIDIAERLGHYEIPDRAFAAPTLTRLRTLAAEVVVLDNEIISVEKEAAIGDRNLVLTVEQQRDLGRTAAIDVVLDMIRERSEQFLLLESRLDQMCETLELTEAEHAAVMRYQTDAVRTVMRGAHDWQQTSLRYGEGYLAVSQ